MNWTHIVESPTDQIWKCDAPRARIRASSYLVGDAIHGAETNTPATPCEYEAQIYHKGDWLIIGSFTELADAQAAVENAALQLFGTLAQAEKELS